MTHRKSITEYPLVAGGSGRSGDDVSRAAWIAFWAFAVVLIATTIGMVLASQGVTQ